MLRRRRPLRENDKISTLKTINNALNADIDKSRNIDKIVKAINNYCKATKSLPALLTITVKQPNHYRHLKQIMKVIISSPLIVRNTTIIMITSRIT